MYKNKVNVNKLKLSNLPKFSIIDNSVFFDIETTGLSPKYNKIISINALLYSNNTAYMYQFFSESDNDEKSLIEEFITLISNKKYIITYNGNTFDIPFINKKCNKYNLNFTLDKLIKIDLYNDINSLKNKLDLENLKLKTVEKFFNINRNDDLNGKDIIKLYTSYSLNNKEVYRNLILKHNFEDVLNLSLLFEKIMKSYDDIIILNYFENKIIIKFLYDNIKVTKKSIIVKLITFKNLKINYVNYSSAYEYYCNSNTGIITVTFRPYMFSDDTINSFLYLLNEDFNLIDYDQIETIRKDIIPIKYSNKIYFNNIKLLVNKIISTIK